MDNWKVYKLEKYVDLLTGFPFKSDFFTDNIGDVPLVKGDNLHQQYILWDIAKRWNKDELDGLKKYQLQVNDIVLAMDRPWIEAGLKYAWIKENDPVCLLVQRIARLRGKNGLETNYLRYIIGSPDFCGYLKNVVTGATVPHISPKQILDFKFLLPPLPIQQKIASILSAYDELIENNKQRIKLLEEMAEEIYKEWFVRLRFPNYENTEFVDGLPLGWEMKEFQFFGEIITGKTPSTLIDDYFNGDVPFVKTPDLSGFPYVISTNESLSVLGAETQNKKFIPKNSLMISCIGSAGVYALASRDCQTNQQINSIKFYQEQYSIYFYCLSQDIKVVLENLGSNGATMTNVNKGKFKKMKALFPTNELLYNYHELVKDNFELILTLQQKNQLLQQTRDLLLPRLISGKLSVAGLLEDKVYKMGENEERLSMAAEDGI